MLKQTPIKYDDFSGGLITSHSALSLLVNQSPDCLNVNSGISKTIKRRGGFDKLNSSSASAGLGNGIYNYVRTADEQYFVALFGSTLKKMDIVDNAWDGTWDTISTSANGTALSDDLAYFTTFNGDCIVTTEDRNVPQKYDPNDNSGAYTNLHYGGSGTAPSGKYCLTWHDHVWIANTATNQDYLYRSAISDHTTWSATDYETIYTSKDVGITGLATLRGRMYIFKKWSIHRITYAGGTPLLDIKEVDSGIGTSSPRSIITISVPGKGELLLFLGSDKQIYLFDGYEVSPISESVYRSNGISPVYLSGINGMQLIKVHAINDTVNHCAQFFIPITFGDIDAYTKLLLHMDGVDGSTAFVDDLNTHTITNLSTAELDYMEYATDITAKAAYPTNEILEGWTVAYDSGELAAAVTSLTISGLNGDVDEEYELITRIVNGYDGSCNYLIRPNNDTGSNYGDQILYGSNITVAAARTTTRTAWGNWAIGSALGSVLFSDTIIHAKSGFVRTIIDKSTFNIATTTIGTVGINGGAWNNTSDEITSLVVLADQTNGFGIGSRVILLKKTTTTTGLPSMAWQEVYRLFIDNELKNGNFEVGVGTPTDWTKVDGTIAQDGTTKKVSSYSTKLTRVTNNAELTQSFHTQRGIAYWKSKTVTFGCWVYATVANRAFLNLSDGVASTTSSAHTGSSTWEWLTVTRTLDASATEATAHLLVANGDTSAYFDGAICRETSTIASTTSLDNFEATSITISGLTGNTDVLYRLRIMGVSGTDVTAGNLMRLNNDTTSNICGYQYLQGTNTATNAQRGTANFIPGGGFSASGQTSLCESLIYAKSGFVRTAITEFTSGILTTTVGGSELWGCSWNNTADEVTSIVISNATANGMAIGTEITLERLNL